MPLTPLVVAAGEILGPALFFSLMNCAVFLPASMALAPSYPLLIAAVCSLPVNAVFFGIENLVFTVYPSRQMPTTPGDFQFMGTAFLLMILKGLLLMVAAIPTAIVGFSLWLLSGPWLALPAMWITTAGTGVAIVFLVARSFDRFDPSLDSPP